ncbi:phosphatidylethanolamine-binding protein 4 [Synchiropus splendidus]|uniref:phosphatidylethanolamine-binding protein 4 n=1 Tax=Synchiropus splendidus TaxID=270530 RepID=UPI00237E7B20|nr:phosphatidylethanolamine-binding protein 4 [Synchiropus splendidus]
MAVKLPALVLCAWVLGLCHVGASAEIFSPDDSAICRGGLEVVYPELDITECLVVPSKFRKKLSTTWWAPGVYFAAAQKDKRYTLVMIDPDAPSHTRPTSASWRHWVVANIKGSDLKQRLPRGTTLTDYSPPTPPRHSGFHRYQFLLFEQHSDMQVALTEQEASSRGHWDLNAFVNRLDLGAPVAAVQFITQNYKD